MKKIFLFLFGVFCLLSAYGQQERVTVAYGDPGEVDPLVWNLLQFERISYLKAMLQGEVLRGKEAVVMKHIVREGVEEREEIVSLVSADSIFEIVFLGKEVDSDSARIQLAMSGCRAETFCPVSGKPILMETYTGMSDYTLTDTIPVAAFTTGLPIVVEMGGEPCEWISYCGLRDAKVHPARWYETYGLPGYTFYTVHFCPMKQ